MENIKNIAEKILKCHKIAQALFAVLLAISIWSVDVLTSTSLLILMFFFELANDETGLARVKLLVTALTLPLGVYLFGSGFSTANIYLACAGVPPLLIGLTFWLHTEACYDEERRRRNEGIRLRRSR